MNIQDQVKAIRSVLIKAHSEVCNTCSFEFVPMLRINGECPCPKCDADVIESVMESQLEQSTTSGSKQVA